MKAPMNSIVVATEEFIPGSETAIEARAPAGNLCVIFEDDGETGYFYAVDTSTGGYAVLDAVHIYSVEGVTDRDKPSTATILWSSDNCKAALLINRRPHAVFDFSRRYGYCQDNFPIPQSDSGWSRPQWSDDVRSLFE
jgi:hypothetical protein